MNPITFSTANGSAPTKIALPAAVKCLEDLTNPYILNSTPAVLSVGLRCRHRGFSFIWQNGYQPCLVTPSWKIVPLDIINDIPYLIEDGSYSVERDPVELAALCGVFLTDDGVQLCTNGFIPNDCAPCSQNNDAIEVCEVGVQCDEYERYSKQDEVNNRDIFWHKNEACPAKKKENLPT